MSEYSLDDSEYFKKRDKEARKFQEFLDKIRERDKKEQEKLGRI